MLLLFIRDLASTRAYLRQFKERLNGFTPLGVQPYPVRFLLTEVGPDNPSVMAHCFPDHTAHSSAADEPESGRVHHVSGFTSRPVFLLSHSYIQFCLVLQLLGESERIISPLCFPFSRENQWPQMKGHFSRVAFLWFKCHILCQSQISQSRSVLLQGPWDTLVAPNVKLISDYVGVSKCSCRNCDRILAFGLQHCCANCPNAVQLNK